MPNPDPQPSSVRLVETTGLAHGPFCGERVPSPHPDCQAEVEPYRAAERFDRESAGIFVRCRCGTAWREVAA